MQLKISVQSLIQDAQNHKTNLILVSSCSCLYPTHSSQVLSKKWKCSWSSTDRRCSNYIWVIIKVIADWGAAYIRSLAVIKLKSSIYIWIFHRLCSFRISSTNYLKPDLHCCELIISQFWPHPIQLIYSLHWYYELVSDHFIVRLSFYHYMGYNAVCRFSWWRHQMETFSALLAICAGNSPVPGEFPTQRPVTRSFDVFFDPRLNKRLSKQSWSWWFETLSRPLWRQCNVS